MLPYLEQGPLYQQWNFSNLSANYVGGISSPAAKVVPGLVCPMDRLSANPMFQGGSNWVAITSYGGNGGTKSFRPSVATADGIFHLTGPFSEPQPNQSPVRFLDVTDGTSQTLLFGERYHGDGGWDSFVNADFSPQPPIPIAPLNTYGAWFGPFPYGIGDVTMCGSSTINYKHPDTYQATVPGPGGVPIPTPPVNGPNFMSFLDLRVGAYGSGHDRGANFAFADGSVRYLRDSIAGPQLIALSTRFAGDLANIE
jgi:prepilin-type processing-associated H-X9-DG protein